MQSHLQLTDPLALSLLTHSALLSINPRYYSNWTQHVFSGCWTSREETVRHRWANLFVGGVTNTFWAEKKKSNTEEIHGGDGTTDVLVPKKGAHSSVWNFVRFKPDDHQHASNALASQQHRKVTQQIYTTTSDITRKSNMSWQLRTNQPHHSDFHGIKAALIFIIFFCHHLFHSLFASLCFHFLNHVKRSLPPAPVHRYDPFILRIVTMDV